jgi:hypothetical protein
MSSKRVNFGQVFHAAPDAFLGIEAVFNAHLGGRLEGQLHQTANPGVAAGLGIEVGFLVDGGGDQAPVESVAFGFPADHVLIQGRRSSTAL